MSRRLFKSSSTPATPTTPSLPLLLPSTLADTLPLPKLIVFDLDYTLWAFWIDTHVTPPIKPVASVLPQGTSYASGFRDKYGEKYTFYEDVPNILAWLKQSDVKVAAASRTHAPELAREALRMLQIPSIETISLEAADGGSSSMNREPNTNTMANANTNANLIQGKPKKAIEYFDYLEIYPGSKMKHFERLKKATGVEYAEMLFLDDERRNREVEALGVTFWLVPDGVDRGAFDRGVGEWRKRRGITRSAGQS